MPSCSLVISDENVSESSPVIKPSKFGGSLYAKTESLLPESRSRVGSVPSQLGSTSPGLAASEENRVSIEKCRSLPKRGNCCNDRL